MASAAGEKSPVKMAPRSGSEREAVLEVEFTARHDQHLYVGDVVRDVARDTPRQHHFLDGRRQRIRNRLRDRAQLDTPRRPRHSPTLTRSLAWTLSAAMHPAAFSSAPAGST